LKKFNIIVVVILIINLLLMIYVNFTVKIKDKALFNKEIYNFDDNWIITNTADTIRQEIDLPYTNQGELPQPKTPLKHADNGYIDEVNNIILENTIPKKYWGLTLTFYSIDDGFRILIDGEKVYETNNEENKNFDRKGSDLHFINIPTDLNEGKIQIELFPSRQIRIENMEIAKRDTAILNWIASNIFNIVCSLIMLLSGVIMLLLASIKSHSRQSTDGMLYLSFFSIDACIYYALNTQIFNIFIGSQNALNLMMYTCLMLLPYFLVIYYEESLAKVFKKRYIILWRIVTANIFLQILLYFTKIIELSKLEIAIHFLIIATVCVTFISLYSIFKSKRKEGVYCEAAAAIFLIVGESANIIRIYILHSKNASQFGRYGITLFCVITMFLHILKVSKGYSESVIKSQRLLQSKFEYMKEQNKKLRKAKEEAEEAKREAIAANETKGKFLANMSHEIRTPINAVLGMDEMILRESNEKSIREYAMDIKTAGQSLLSLINDILDFSKIDSGKMEIIPIEYDFSSMVHDVVNMIVIRAQSKDIKFNVDVNPKIPAVLYGDDVRIRQVLINILTNAVKYTEKGEINFIIDGHLKEPDTILLYFEVKDTGIGIKEEDLIKLFMEFERIEEKKNRSIEGSGLGMTITASLLTLMDSKLEVESKYGFGSKFFFEIEQKVINKEPIGDLEERIKHISEEYNYNTVFKAPDANILVVDDNLVNLKVFKNLLKETEISIDTASSGKECIEKAVLNHYDLIFIDHMMPEMDGIETFEKLREMDQYASKEAKKIVLTANAVSGAKEMYLKKGFDAFLSKPILPEKLEKLICNFLPKELIAYLNSENTAQNLKENKEEDLQQIPDIDGLDWDYAKLHLPNKEIIIETIKDFYSTIENQADLLNESYLSGNLNSYRIQVHGMKSSAAIIGLVYLSGVAKLLENAAKQEQREIIDNLHNIFLNEWIGYKQKLSVLFEENKQETKDTSIAFAYLQMLSMAMEEMDIDGADDAMENLNKLFYNLEIENQIQKLSADVASLNTEEALKQIELIKNMLLNI